MAMVVVSKLKYDPLYSFIPVVHSKMRQQSDSINFVTANWWVMALLQKFPHVTHISSSCYSKLSPQHWVENIIDTRGLNIVFQQKLWHKNDVFDEKKMCGTFGVPTPKHCPGAQPKIAESLQGSRGSCVQIDIFHQYAHICLSIWTVRNWWLSTNTII